MSLFRGRYRSDSIRLTSHDYSSPGWYHVVICTAGRARVFGKVRNGIMGLSHLGAIAHRFCAEIPDHHARAVVDEFVIMPDHVHALIELRDDVNDASSIDSGVEEETFHETSLLRPNTNAQMSRISPSRGSISVIVRLYKGAVTRWARRHGYPHFAWQPRFYDRIIRDERHLYATRAYIAHNPVRWEG